MATTIDDTPPRKVDGYDHALANGVVRRVPSRPPALLPGPTAAVASRDWWCRTLPIAVVGYLVVEEVLGRLDWSLSWIVSLAVGLGAFAVVILRARAMSRVQMREFAAGYTTAPKLGISGRTHNGSDPWDYRGLWILDREGKVIREPDPSVDPPGMYPSPNRPDKLQLWTGEVWGDDYRDP